MERSDIRGQHSPHFASLNAGYMRYARRSASAGIMLIARQAG
jgi:hypothetical protein